MRPRSKPPLNRRFFHTKPKKDSRDMARLKKTIQAIHQKKQKQESDRQNKRF